MGHPVNEFKALLAEFKGKDQVEIDRAYLASLSNSVPLLDQVKEIVAIPATLKKDRRFFAGLETHCFELAHEFLKPKSGNFTQTALHFVADGLLATYHYRSPWCSRDDQYYDVKITVRKD
jgi:hypothetical protein